MTDDEAFIRAILARPGDDTPRLAYADWLDDRGDPRGPFLRAEVEAPGARWLKALTPGLDLVWVARICRPPLGICDGSIAGEAHHEPLLPEAIAKYQDTYVVSLPFDYQAFLLNYNGGTLRWKGEPRSGTSYSWQMGFHCFLPLERVGEPSQSAILRCKIIAIGQYGYPHNSEYQLTMNVTGSGYGSVYIERYFRSDQTSRSYTFVAESFASLYNLLPRS